MPSKYDAYWVNRLSELAGCFERAHREGRAWLEVSDIRAFGNRRSWRGTAVVRSGSVLSEDARMPSRSLARVVTSAGLVGPETYRLRMGSDRLEIQLLDVEPAAPSAPPRALSGFGESGRMDDAEPTGEKDLVADRKGSEQSWLLHPIGSDRIPLDATFEILAVPVFDLVYHHKAGGRHNERSVNVDYHEALELLLSRLASLRATVLGIAVDSSVARNLPLADRELNLPFPIELTPETSCAELRLQITRAQKSVARRPYTEPGGGNDQKRIRITVSFDDMTGDTLRNRLVGG